MTVLRARVTAFVSVFALSVTAVLYASGAPALASSRPTRDPGQAAA
jgi:hypothetical protein